MHDNVLLSGKANPDTKPSAASDDIVESPIPAVQASPDFPALSFDAGEFIQYVKDHDLSEAEAYEFLATVWVYVVAFVDMGFGIHPIQGAQTARRANAHGNNPALDHESALVLTCRETFNKRTSEKIVQRPKRRRAGRRDS